MIITLLILLIHNLQYRSPEWKEYRNFNNSRTTVYDYNSLPNYWENLEFYEEIGIKNANEMHLLQSQNTTLISKIDNEMMEKIAQKSQEMKKENEKFYRVPISVLFKYITWMFNSSFVSILNIMLIMLIFGISISKNKYRYILQAIVAEITKAGMVCFLIYKGRYIERATYPINILELMILIAILYSYSNDVKNKNIAYLKKEKLMKATTYFVLSFFSILISLVFYRAELSENKALINSRFWEPTVTNYFENEPGSIYFFCVMGTGQLRSPVFGEESKASPNRCDMGGWRSKSPIEKMSLERNGIESCSESLLMNESVYWVQLSDYPFAWLEEVLKDETNHIKIILCDTIELDGKTEYNVYKIEKKESNKI